MFDIFFSHLLEEYHARYRKGIYGFCQYSLAYNSNKIEGSRLTESQTADLFLKGEMIGSSEMYRSKDIEELSGHFSMFNYMLDTLDLPLSSDLIKQLHWNLKCGVFEDKANGYAIGEYKTRQNIVGTYMTAKPADVPALMDELLYCYNNKNFGIDTLAGFHLRYEQIHPFQDGNGRTGRMLLFRESLKHQLIPPVIQDCNRAEYISVLRNDSISDLSRLLLKEQKAFEVKISNFI